MSSRILSSDGLWPAEYSGMAKPCLMPLCARIFNVCVHPSQLFASQGSTKMDNARITCTEGVLWSLLEGSQSGWLHACFVSSKTCHKLSVVLDTSEIPMYFVLWQDLDQLAAGLCCKAAANVLCP